MAHIKVGLGVPKLDLVVPMKRLIASKKIAAKGVKRATTYSPIGGGLVMINRAKAKPEQAASST